MMPMLQTSPDFPSWATDASIPNLQRQESMIRQNDVAEYIQQWTPTEITDAEGRRFFVLAKPAGSSDNTGSAWGIISGDRGRYRIRAGRIFANPSDPTTPLDIVGANDEISLGNGTAAWIELEMQTGGAYAVKLKSGSTSQWKDYPEPYELTTEQIPKLKFARFLFWTFHSGTPAPSDTLAVGLGRGIYGRPVRRSPDLFFLWTARTFDTATRRRGFVPALISM